MIIVLTLILSLSFASICHATQPKYFLRPPNALHLVCGVAAPPQFKLDSYTVNLNPTPNGPVSFWKNDALRLPDLNMPVLTFRLSQNCASRVTNISMTGRLSGAFRLESIHGRGRSIIYAWMFPKSPQLITYERFPNLRIVPKSQGLTSEALRLDIRI